MFATSAREQMGSKNIEIRCDLKNYDEKWRHFDVVRNNVPVIRVLPDGRVQTRFNRKRVVVKPTIENHDASVNVKFVKYRCRDEGRYTCLIDNKHPQDMIAVVTSKLKRFPIFQYFSFEDTRLNFNVENLKTKCERSFCSW